MNCVVYTPLNRRPAIPAEGTVVPAAEVVVPSTPKQAAELIALDPRRRQQFKLIEKEHLSHNVRRLRFALQSENHKFGLPVGKHVFLYAKCVYPPPWMT